MNIIKKFLISLGLMDKWICLKGCELELTTDKSWIPGYTAKYKLIKGRYIKRETSEPGSGDDDIGATSGIIFIPKTQQVKILVWITYTDRGWVVSKEKTIKYIIVLNKKYKKDVVI